MQDSITIAEVGSIENVRGSRIATPLGPPSPGNTPTKTPSTSPTIISASVFQVRRTANPCSRRPKASISQFHLLRHCEERSDDPIQELSGSTLDCFASLATTIGERID